MHKSLALALLLGGCLPPERPEDPAEWDACLLASSKLVVETLDDEPNMQVKPNGQSVLLLTTRWGAGGAIAIEHTWGSLLVELPAALRRGDVVRFDGEAKAEYAEGHSVSSYRSQRVKGSVTVLAIDGDAAELRIDLAATEPIVDRENRGVVPMKGVIDARRAQRRLDCP